jgi:hypothetical protein
MIASTAPVLPDQVTGVYEQDLAVFITLMEAEADSQWAQATWAYAMTGRYGRRTAALLAGDTGLSAGYVRQLVATARAFPTPADRAADLSFSHHRVAAMTTDPAQWITAAAAHQWSVDDLRLAIRAARDPVADADQARRAAARLARAVARHNARWAAWTGVATLTFGPPAAP